MIKQDTTILEFRHLQTLRAIAEAGNLSKAAQRLYLSQSALSHQIKLLEGHYEMELFERKSNPLRWSAAGQRLVGLAYEMDGLLRDAERDIAAMKGGAAGELRIAVECHSCFDWLMPSMDAFRERWAEVEQDLVSGFHADPVGLLAENEADLVLVSSYKKRARMVFHPLFRYDMPALLAPNHPLLSKRTLEAIDFADQTLITYPVPDERLDLVREVLKPAGVEPARRTAQLTIAILQLVASRRGITALPRWAVQNYLDSGYVIARPITPNGLQCNLYAVTTRSAAATPFMRDFIKTMKDISFGRLEGVYPIE
ncbi:MAG TPA: LysR family transcriptional regulator [Abditibacteriaceae bacterium]|jgi:LysR family transcriptional regulator for metE and metH